MSLKVVAFSGSPRSASFTDKLLDLFLDGMGQDIELDKFYPRKMDIQPCLGCLSCWKKETKGKCSQKDDMQIVLPKADNADVIVIACPLYVDGFPFQMKKVLDRFLSLLDYLQVVDEAGHTRHPRLHPKKQKAVLISSCGFPEIDNFDSLKIHFGAICRNAHWENCGAILISAAGMANAPGFFNKKYELIKQAGKQFIGNGIMSKELREEISKEIIDRQTYREIVNAFFEGGIFETTKAIFKTMFAKRTGL